MAPSPTASPPAASPVTSSSTNSTPSASPRPPPSAVPTPSPPAPPTPVVASTPPPSPSSVPPTTSNSPPPTSPPPPTSSGTGSPPSPPPPPSTKASPPPPPSPTSTKASPPPPPSTKASPPPPPSTKSTTTTSPSTSSSISSTSLIGVGVAGVIAASVILLLLICLCKKKKRKRYYPGEYYGPPGGPPAHYKEQYFAPDERQQWGRSPAGPDSMVQMSPTPHGSLPPPIPSPKNGYSPIPPAPVVGPASMGNSKSWFTYQELATATGGFAKSNILGEGGFGFVYKGVLPGGQVVAVKQLKVGGQQGEKEFRAEVEIISRVHHRHLVSLVGYCIADTQRLLVYDYVPNGTVDYHLHRNRGRSVMDWPTRVKIASGAARGLAYLHEDCHPRIIHRDIKASNILLDNNFEAQVSDFGLAKLTSDTNTHVTTRVMGTFGYLAPEYASSGKLTEKSDVFSFGVVLLELVTGRKPVDQNQPIGEESLVEWARPVLTQITSEEDLDLLADPSLNGVYDKKEMLRMIEAAAACIRHSVTRRPRMGQVVRALEGDASLADLNKGIKPGHSSFYNTSFTSSDYDNSNYSTDIRRFRQVALESQEYGSEYSGATSDYGLNPSASSSEYQTSAEVDRKIGKSQPSKPKSVRKNLSTSSSNEPPIS